MDEHDYTAGADDGILEELRRRANVPDFPAEEIEVRIRASITRRTLEQLEVGSASATEWGASAEKGVAHAEVRPDRRPMSAASEESETVRSDRRAAWGGKIGRSFVARAVLTAAASLALFIAGAEYGRRTAPLSIVVPAPVGSAEARTDLPYSIQSAGSQYVATLAMFSGQADSLSGEERRIAREVALAALYSASVELLREAGDDEMLRAVTEMVARRRNTMGASAIDAGTRF